MYIGDGFLLVVILACGYFSWVNGYLDQPSNPVVVQRKEHVPEVDGPLCLPQFDRLEQKMVKMQANELKLEEGRQALAREKAQLEQERAQFEQERNRH